MMLCTANPCMNYSIVGRLYSDGHHIFQFVMEVCSCRRRDLDHVSPSLHGIACANSHKVGFLLSAHRVWCFGYLPLRGALEK